MALSKVIGVYRLTQDVTLPYLASGSALATLHLVHGSKYKAQDGTQKEERGFIEGVVYARLAEVANQYLHKGSKISVVAELKQDTWTDNEGKNRSKHSLKIDSFEMLDSKPSDGNSQQSQPKQYQKQENKLLTNELPEIYIDMDDNSEVPFKRG